MSTNGYDPLAADALGVALGLSLDADIDRLKLGFQNAQAIRVQNAAALRDRLVAEVVIRPDAKPNDAGWTPAVCPRCEEHTGGDETGTYVRLEGDQVAFKCFHSHGNQYRTRQFLDEISKAKEHLPEFPVFLADRTDNEFSWEEPDRVLIASERGPVPPVPLDALPPACAEWVRGTAESTGAPQGYTLLGLLIAGAAAAGRNVEIAVGETWTEPLVLWGMLVGNPSIGKSPILANMQRVLELIQKLLRRHNDDAMSQYNAAKLARAVAKDANRRALKNKSEPAQPILAEPQPPPHLQLVIQNATIESIFKALAANPRGLLAIHDELASLLLNLARYSTGSDRPLYLEAWAAARWIINRASLDRPLEIPSASLSMIGGIQPEKLQEFLREEADDGLAARFVYTWPDPPPRVPLYQRATPDHAAMSDALMRLWQVAASPASPHRLSIDARTFDPHHERLHLLQAGQTDYLAGFVGKGYGTIVRLAGILTLLEWATGPADAPLPHAVSDAALNGAVRLWHDYFLPHARACLRPGQKPGFEQKLRRVLLYMREHRVAQIGSTEVRVQALGRTLTAGEVGPILKELVCRGWLRSVSRTSSGPGRPANRWEVNPQLHR